MSVRQKMASACKPHFVSGDKKCHGEIDVTDQEWNEAADNDADRKKRVEADGRAGCLAACQCQECDVTLTDRKLSAVYVKTGGPKANTMFTADD